MRPQRYVAVGSDNNRENVLAMMDEDHASDLHYASDDEEQEEAATDAHGAPRVDRSGAVVVHLDLDVENRDLNKSILGEGQGKRAGHDKHVAVSALDEKRRMERMDVVANGERAPTQVAQRRRLALCAVLLFVGVLMGIVVVEGVVSGVRQGLFAQKRRAPGRKDVYLITFTNDGAPLAWNATSVVGSKAFAVAALTAMSKIVFHDFSVEFAVRTASDLVEIACVEEKHRELFVPSSNCSADLASVVTSVASLPVERCKQDTTTPLQHALTCYHSRGEASPTDDPKLVAFWQGVFSGVGFGEAFNSRCCDPDQVYVDLARLGTLEICKASADAGEKILRYYGKEETRSCSASMCGCECFADESAPSKVDGSRCPRVPDQVKGINMCALAASQSSTKLTCAGLPALASRFKAQLRHYHVDLGADARCYGAFNPSA